LVVAPGADAGAAQFALDGVRDVTVGPDGSLRATTDLGVLRHGRPVAYQTVNGARRRVQAAFVVEDGCVRFDVGAYDRKLPLVVDPSLDFSSYYGGTSTDIAWGIGIDAEGNQIFGGYTYGADLANNGTFPLVSPYQPNFGGGYTGYT
jgi:hypothetical protein